MGTIETAESKPYRYFPYSDEMARALEGYRKLHGDPELPTIPPIMATESMLGNIAGFDRIDDGPGI